MGFKIQPQSFHASVICLLEPGESRDAQDEPMVLLGSKGALLRPALDSHPLSPLASIPSPAKCSADLGRGRREAPEHKQLFRAAVNH